MKNILCFISILFVMLAGCREDNTKSKSGKLYVVATTGMVADVITNIGGDSIVVEGLMGPGIDPHTYNVSDSDRGKLVDADVVIYNGLHLEGKMGDILTKVGRSKPVYTVTEDIPKNLLREPPEFEGLYDPHIWFDVSLWKYAATKVEEALAKADPKNSKKYKGNANKYRLQLDQLHKWAQQRIATIPKENRTLITAHDAFGYFGDAYGIKVLALQGVSTASKVGEKDRDRLIQHIVKNKIRAIFVETSVSDKDLHAVAEGCKAQGHNVIISDQKLFSDAMGVAGTPEGTYVGMVKHNVNAIVNALGGTPERN